MQGRAIRVMARSILVLASCVFRAATAIEAAAPASSAPEAAGPGRLPDREAPVILALPVKPTSPAEPLVLRARVTDPSGVREARLLAKGERDREYVSIAMVEVEDGTYAATLPPTPGRGSYVTFMVEATDGIGNGPRRAGEPGAPFVAPLLAGAGAIGRSRRVSLPYLVGLAAAAIAIPAAGAWRLRSRHRAREQAAGERIAAPPRDPRRERISEDLFWLRLLTPLIDLPPEELQEALRELLSKEHPHPLRGPSRFGRQVVIARLRWAQSVDPARVLASWRESRRGLAQGFAAQVGEASPRREALR